MEEITSSSLKLAQGMSEYGIALVLTSVVLVVFVIHTLVDVWKRRKESDMQKAFLEKMMDNFSTIQEQTAAANAAIQRQFIEQMSANMNSMMETNNAVKEYFMASSMRKVNVDQAREIVKVMLGESKYRIMWNISKIKKDNKLSDVASVLNKINMLVINAYDDNDSFLKKFDFGNKSMSSLMEEQWKKEISDMVVKDCSTVDFNPTQLESNYIAIFESIGKRINKKIDNAH